MKTLRFLFERLSLRERLFLVVFLTLALLMWFGALSRNLRLTLKELQDHNNILSLHTVLLDNEEFIVDRLRVAREGLDGSKTFSSEDLFGKVDTLVRTFKLNADIRSPQSRQDEIFSTYAVRLEIKNATLHELIAFTQSVQAEAPYLNLTRFQIDPISRDPRRLNAQVEIESFEITQEIF
jgi:hypothetical protein